MLELLFVELDRGSLASPGRLPVLEVGVRNRHELRRDLRIRVDQIALFARIQCLVVELGTLWMRLRVDESPLPTVDRNLGLRASRALTPGLVDLGKRQLVVGLRLLASRCSGD